MIHQLLSGDLPRSRTLAAVLTVIFIGLAFAPFIVPGAKALDVAANVCIFIVLAASFDLLIGYTGVLSFAQTIFFGVGAYSVAIALARIGSTWPALLIGLGLGQLVSLVLAFVIGIVSLRVPIITLAFAVAFETLALQFSNLTGGSDGLSARLPREMTPAFSLSEGSLLGVALNGKLVAYYLVFLVCAAMFLLMLRVVNSPFGRVLQAIRENSFRAEAIGYRVALYRSLSIVISAGFATMAGALLTVWVRYTAPSTTLSLDIMLYLLLMVVIGGMGTLYGSAVGATLVVIAQSYLQDFIGLVGRPLENVPGIGGFLSALVSPNRWLLWLGVLFVIAVCFFPAGIVGKLRERRW